MTAFGQVIFTSLANTRCFCSHLVVQHEPSRIGESSTTRTMPCVECPCTDFTPAYNQQETDFCFCGHTEITLGERTIKAHEIRDVDGRLTDVCMECFPDELAHSYQLLRASIPPLATQEASFGWIGTRPQR